MATGPAEPFASDETHWESEDRAIAAGRQRTIGDRKLDPAQTVIRRRPGALARCAT